MNRKDFIKHLWFSLIKPVIILMLGYYCLKFLVSALNENGAERFATFLILSLALLFSLVYFTGIMTRRLGQRIYEGLSDQAKFRLLALKKISDYLALVILGAVLHHFWMKDAMMAFILILLLLLDKISHIIFKQNDWHQV